MTGNFNIGKSWFKLAWLCIVVLLSTCSLNVMGQVVDTSGPDRAYCVGAGNLYATTPGLNNGKPVCQFSDNTWCDAHAFFTGNCTGNATTNYPYSSNTPLSALDLADATKTCQTRGGQVENVHTPYGDVNLCVFPDGSSIDLRSLSSAVYNNGINGMPDNGIYYLPDNGIYNTPYNGVYYTPYNGSDPLTGNGLYDANAWYYGAYAFLNSP